MVDDMKRLHLSMFCTKPPTLAFTADPQTLKAIFFSL